MDSRIARLGIALLSACLWVGCVDRGTDRVVDDVAEGLAAYESGQLASARSSWVRAAEAGNTEAQYYLGVLSNEGFEGDAADASRWFEIAANKGHAQSQFNLALAHERGLGVVRSRETAIAWLERAAAQGHGDSQHMLGLLLLDRKGSGNRADPDAGMKWLSTAAGSGHGPAQLALGSAYLRGEVVAADPVLAERWLSSAMEAGILEALRPLMAARKRLQAPVDASLPELQEAAQAGDPDAQHALAARLLSGKDASLHRDAAKQWLRKSAGQGHARARYDLGLLLSKEAASSAEGISWIRRSAEDGFAPAQYALGLAHAGGNVVDRDEAEALRWYSMAAAQGMPSAEYAMGYALSQGVGSKRDDVEAMRWFRLAASHGHGQAAFRISNMYANGEGVAKDPGEVRRWECRAFVLGNPEAARILARRGGVDGACGHLREDLAEFAIDALGQAGGK